MTLLAPLFLVGLAAIALPIWLHRLKTQSPDREPFSSTMFLEPSEQRVHVRRQLRYWLLLCLRVLLLALAALAFAKPVLQRPPQVLSGAAPVQHLIVVDTSLSMGHGARMADARDTARAIVAGAAPIDRLQIIAAASSMEVLAGPTRDRPLLAAAIAGLVSGAGRIDLGALVSEAGSLVDPQLAPNEQIQLHLISDLQASGLPTRFADLVPGPVHGRPMDLRLHPVASTDTANWTIESLRAVGDGVEVGVRSFASTAAVRTVALTLNDEGQGSQSQTVAPGALAVFSFAAPVLVEGDNRLTAQLITDDELPADDARYAVIDNAPPAPVLVLTRDKQGLPVTYLSTALATIPGGYAAEATHVADLDPRILSRYAWLLIDDLGIVNDGLAEALTAFLQGGGHVLAAVGDGALGRQNLPVTGHEVLNGGPAASGLRSVTTVELSHPVLAATRGWRSVSVAQRVPVRTTAQDRILLGLSDGQALLLERSFGAGRMLLLTTRLDNAWSDLPVQPVFVNFVAEVARYLSGADRVERQQIAGSSLALRQSGGASGQIIDPSGRTVLALADTRRAVDVRLSQTGFYEVYTPGSETLIAVNPDIRESDLTTMSKAQQDDWRELLAAPPEAVSTAANEEIAAAPVALWQGVLVLLAIVVLAESLLGNGYLSQRRGAA